MNWPWKTFLRISKHNGAIIISKSSGRWEVFVGGTRQTSARYGLLWKDAFEHCKEHFDARIVRHTLMFGLAAGGAVGTIYESFPQTDLIAVEHDEEMVAIAQELELYAPHPAPKILTMDAQEAAQRLLAEGKRFELVIIDIFTGSAPSPLVGNSGFLTAIKALLAPGGLAVVNVSGTVKALEGIRPLFLHHATWRYDLNHFGAFWE